MSVALGLALAAGRGRWGCHECEADDAIWARRGLCGSSPMAWPVRASSVAQIPEDCDMECTHCPIASARQPWVSAVLDARVRVQHAPLEVVAPNPTPALVEALDVMERTARGIREDDQQREAGRADVRQKLATFGRKGG